MENQEAIFCELWEVIPTIKPEISAITKSGMPHNHKSSDKDYTYEKVGDSPIRRQKIHLPTFDGFNAFSYHSNQRWYTVTE